MKERDLILLASAMAGLIITSGCFAATTQDNDLRVVIIRHGEKPDTGDHLSCQGENRALGLATVLYEKFKKPDHIYVPSMGVGKSKSHARMFETIIPFAVKYNLTINSEFGVTSFPMIAERVLKKTGTVLMVWQHDAIPELVRYLGVSDPPKWKGKDFDSIWIITFADGKASLSKDSEGIHPSINCTF